MPQPSNRPTWTPTAGGYRLEGSVRATLRKFGKTWVLDCCAAGAFELGRRASFDEAEGVLAAKGLLR